MPELPEVETIKNQLLKKVKGKTLKAVEIRLPKLVRSDLKEFKKKIVGAKIEDIKRRAKIFIFELDNNFSLIIHLKMTGQLIFNGPKTKHSYFIYEFTDGSHLIHNDMRQFGYVKLIASSKVSDLFLKEKFGPEPLQKDFTLDNFKEALQKRARSKIKLFLMDQKNIAGIGNIYSDEILFYAAVRPNRKVSSLKQKEVEKIFKGISVILKKAIKNKGTSDQWYVDSQGKKGNFQNILKVYRKKDKLCSKCRAPIQRLKMNSRSAHFCPKCQK